MSEPIPAPSGEKKAPRKPAGPIDAKLLADIKRGEDVSEGAQDPLWVAALTEEGVTATAATELAAKCSEARAVAAQIITATQLKESSTKKEQAAAKVVMQAFRDIQKRAKRKFAGDAANQKAYFIGNETFGVDRTHLEQDGVTLLARAAADNLPGMTPAKLASANTAFTNWKQADADQQVAIRGHGTLLKQLEGKVAAINVARRDIQIAGDTALVFSNPNNANNRRLLLLPPNAPYNPGLGAQA